MVIGDPRQETTDMAISTSVEFTAVTSSDCIGCDNKFYNATNSSTYNDTGYPYLESVGVQTLFCKESKDTISNWAGMTS